MPRLLSSLPLQDHLRSASIRDGLGKGSVRNVVENVAPLLDTAVAEDQEDVVLRQVKAVDEAYNSCGRRLRHRRLETNGNAVNIARQLRIPVAYLDAIEAGRWEQLPGRAYAIGYVRAYAEILGLDADEIVASAKSEIAPVNANRLFRFPAPIYQPGRTGTALVLSVLVISLVVAAVLYL